MQQPIDPAVRASDEQARRPGCLVTLITWLPLVIFARIMVDNIPSPDGFGWLPGAYYWTALGALFWQLGLFRPPRRRARSGSRDPFAYPFRPVTFVWTAGTSLVLGAIARLLSSDGTWLLAVAGFPYFVVLCVVWARAFEVTRPVR
jgi:hypothetical protein